MKNYLPSIALVITFLIMLSIMPGPDYLVAQSITAQCSDGQDNDNDSKIDYPNDTGCQNTQDNDETNPPFDRALPGVGVGSGGTVGMIQYPISVLANQPNNYFIEKRDGVNVERVPLQVAALPKKTGTPL
ncbi:MAG: hypothetical protein U1C97_02085, partial [Candidatus Gracilibacteria bacterium]|nr:hypothetical protein [Candidatus Gracilibacteria bacterium]